MSINDKQNIKDNIKLVHDFVNVCNFFKEMFKLKNQTNRFLGYKYAFTEGIKKTKHTTPIMEWT